MSDTAQQGLKEPEQTDWDNYNSGSRFVRPPVPIGADGKMIQFTGMVDAAKETDPDAGYLQYLLDPITIQGPEGAGYSVRFTRASARPFARRINGELVPMKGNPNKLANFLRAIGLQVKPQRNEEYRTAVKAALKRPFPFVGDWEAYNTETQERVRGYANFPDDPDRPGQKKAILTAGDVVTERDAKGNITGTKTIKSEVLFANFRLRYFVDRKRK